MPTITGGISIGGGQMSENLKDFMNENGVKIPFTFGTFEYTNPEINGIKVIDPVGKEFVCDSGLVTEVEPE